MTLDEQVRDAFDPVRDLEVDEDAAWARITGRSGERRRSRWPVAVAAVVVALAVIGSAFIFGGDDRPTQITTGTDAPEVPAQSETTVTLLREQKQPPQRQGREIQRVATQMIVISGANPNDNETLILSVQDLVESDAFRAEVANDAGTPDAEFEVVACRPAGSAVLNVEVHQPDQETAWLLAKQLVPTLRRIIEADQRTLPPEMRVTGPIVTELGIEGRSTISDEQVPCSS